MEPLLPLETRLRNYLDQNSLIHLNKISKGYSSEVHLVKNRRNHQYALKIERDKSSRKRMAENEVQYLEVANSKGIGPKLLDHDIKNRIILMKYIEGMTFNKFIEGLNEKSQENKRHFENIVQNLFEQAKQLDDLGLDHGQLNGKGKNILVSSDGKPTIIDFEKASIVRKVHNVTSLEALLYRNKHSFIVRKIKKIEKGK